MITKMPDQREILTAYITARLKLDTAAERASLKQVGAHPDIILSGVAVAGAATWAIVTEVM